jgi:hypothetical protein
LAAGGWLVRSCWLNKDNLTIDYLQAEIPQPLHCRGIAGLHLGLGSGRQPSNRFLGVTQPEAEGINFSLETLHHEAVGG